ncbi:Hypothetical protein CINCED_3A011530 [Cinara cedri]|uniref:Uncharacterized protein n=1 Tax=Cinara cedri TaxID=506608 RepID=A0A5E4MWW9_9HEMI|nr:Hypothetical protein CINCED_3A011530 [Cinara cedri]
MVVATSAVKLLVSVKLSDGLDRITRRRTFGYQPKIKTPQEATDDYDTDADDCDIDMDAKCCGIYGRGRHRCMQANDRELIAYDWVVNNVRNVAKIQVDLYVAIKRGRPQDG